MRAKHASNSYKCITKLIVTRTKHHYVAWVWSYTTFVHNARTARNMPHYYPLRDHCVQALVQGKGGLCVVHRAFVIQGLGTYKAGMHSGSLAPANVLHNGLGWYGKRYSVSGTETHMEPKA